MTQLDVLPAPSAPARREPAGRPYNLDAEESLLACCLIAEDARAAVTRCLAAKLTAKSFYDFRNGALWDALVALHTRQEAIAQDTVGVELQQSGRLEEAGGWSHFSAVTARGITSAQLNTHLRVVRETWILREMMAQAEKLIEACREPGATNLGDRITPRVTWFQNGLARILHGERAGHTLAERVTEVADELAARAAGTEDKSRWVRTGMARVDEVFRPFGSDVEDHLVVVGGGSSSGKSALMRQWAGAALRAGQTVLSYTRETSVKGFIRQLASHRARVDLRTLDGAPLDLAAKLTDECRALGGLVDRSLFVFQHEPGCELTTIEDLVSHARAFAWQRGAPHLMIVDYLQLFGTRRRCNNREQEVAHVSHTLQALQRELGCVMLVGAQLNESGLKEMRQAKKDDSGRPIHRLPNAGDFRESQAIYHDADRVVAIYRPPEDCRGADNYGPDVLQPEQWLVQIKRRYGGEGTVRCWFEKRYLTFREFGRGEVPEAAPQQKPAGAMTPEEKRRALAAKKAAREDAF